MIAWEEQLGKNKIITFSYYLSNSFTANADTNNLFNLFSSNYD